MLKINRKTPFGQNSTHAPPPPPAQKNIYIDIKKGPLFNKATLYEKRFNLVLFIPFESLTHLL